MNIHPVSVAEALEYVEKAQLMPLEGELSLGHLSALTEHLEHSVSCLIALVEQLQAAESAIVQLTANNEDLSALILQFLAETPPDQPVVEPKRMYDEDTDRWYTLDPTGYWQAEMFPPDPARPCYYCGTPTEIAPNGFVAIHHPPDSYQICAVSGTIWTSPAQAFPDPPVGLPATTVEFRTTAEIMDRHQPEIIKTLAKTIAAEFGGQRQIGDCKDCRKFRKIGRAGCLNHFPTTQSG